MLIVEIILEVGDADAHPKSNRYSKICIFGWSLLPEWQSMRLLITQGYVDKQNQIFIDSLKNLPLQVFSSHNLTQTLSAKNRQQHVQETAQLRGRGPAGHEGAEEGLGKQRSSHDGAAAT